MKKALSLETLQDIDQGKIAVALELELKKIGQDLNDRPGDKSTRVLLLGLARIRARSPRAAPKPTENTCFLCNHKAKR